GPRPTNVSAGRNPRWRDGRPGPEPSRPYSRAGRTRAPAARTPSSTDPRGTSLDTFKIKIWEGGSPARSSSPSLGGRRRCRVLGDSGLSKGTDREDEPGGSAYRAEEVSHQTGRAYGGFSEESGRRQRQAAHGAGWSRRGQPMPLAVAAPCRTSPGSRS